MTNQRKFDSGSMRRAIDEVGASPAAIAAYLGCTRSTVYKYLRTQPELKAAYEAAKGEPVEARKKFSRADVVAAIEQSHGVKSAVAGLLGCSRQTVDNYLAEWPELAEAFEAARGGLIGKALNSLVADIENPLSDGHVRAYMYVLSTLGKKDGFSERVQLSDPDDKPISVNFVYREARAPEPLPDDEFDE